MTTGNRPSGNQPTFDEIFDQIWECKENCVDRTEAEDLLRFLTYLGTGFNQVDCVPNEGGIHCYVAGRDGFTTMLRRIRYKLTVHYDGAQVDGNGNKVEGELVLYPPSRSGGRAAPTRLNPGWSAHLISGVQLLKTPIGVTCEFNKSDFGQTANVPILIFLFGSV